MIYGNVGLTPPSAGIQAIHIRGYRSLRDLHLRADRLNIVTGPNGSGKSNVYRSQLLLKRSADGRLAEALASEGGVASALWAGRRRPGAVRVHLEVRSEDFMYSLEFGLRRRADRGSLFCVDPEVKTEQLSLPTPDGSQTVFLQRRGKAARVRDRNGRLQLYALDLADTESALSQIRDPDRYPELTIVRERLQRWRFYHQFATDSQSPIRSPQVGTLTPILSDDGRNLVAALQTIHEFGPAADLHGLFNSAFPGATLQIRLDDRSRLVMEMRHENLQRSLDASEFSDGTLKYLCLLAALLSTRPPGVIVLNEPEVGLHADLYAPVAKLMALASKRSQIWIVTHATALAKAIAEAADQRAIRLALWNGETTVEQGHANVQ